MRLAALSVDLDEIPCYHAIHGLAPADERAAHRVYDTAVARLAELFRSLDAPCTFFVIGADLAHEPAARAAKALFDAGHELANHSQHHRYDLVRLSRERQRGEVLDAMVALERLTGARPSGFRSPGYTTSDALLSVLEELGVEYDSSVFPCPAYFAAKTAAIGLIAARGRRSRSIVDTPRVLTASADPYRPGVPYWTRGARALVELPIGVTRGARLPFIGTSLVLAGPRGAAALAQTMRGRPLVNLELHGLDVLGAREDGLEGLAQHQGDLRISVERKLETLAATVRALRSAGYEFVTLAQAASRARREGLA